jgi:mRNA interferase MazF
MTQVRRGEIWWADLPEPRGSEPGLPRPVLIVQANAFNQSRIRTILVALITSNLALGGAPGNVALSSRFSGLPQESVINVSQLYTLDRNFLRDRLSRVPPSIQELVDAGLRTILAL